jgi:hypothetical protein
MKFCLVVPEICREICCSCAKEKKEKENTENNNNNNNNNNKKRSKNNKSPKLCVRNLINLFSPWYSWKIAELALSNNHSLTILRCEFVPRSGEVYSIPHYVIKFVSVFRQVCCFLRVLRFLAQIKQTATI